MDNTISNIKSQEYSDVIKKSYIDYSMSVITARALPDIRDGLKPVQRRILYDMSQLHVDADKPHRKVARIVGDTMGKFHPHGDASISDALVVLAQDFKKNQVLIDGHGNFGSIEGDGAAAARYIECRLTEYTQDAYLSDINENIIEYTTNYDGSEKEPVVLPAKVPNLLINGSEGIAVGMATNTPTHNLSEVIDACKLYLHNNTVTNEELLKVLKGPDFPTGGLVVNKNELLDIYSTGQGRLKIRGKIIFEPADKKNKYDKLVITEIPYTMIGNGISGFISDVIKLVEEKKTSDIVDISNETSKDGIRIVLYIKKNTDIENLKALLYKKTKLEDTFSVNMLAIVNGKPETLSLKDIIKHHIDFRFALEKKKYEYLLENELINKEIQDGLITACDIIDLIIEILRGSKTIKDSKECLMLGNTSNINFKFKSSEEDAKKLHFTERQAQAILDMKLSKLINLEIDLLKKKQKESINKITKYRDILTKPTEMIKVIDEDYDRLKKKYGKPRKTEIIDDSNIIYIEKDITPQEIVFLMNRFGYFKVIDRNYYDKNKELIDNENNTVIPCMSNSRIMIFTNNGNMHQIKLQDIPIIKYKDKGVPIDNVCNYNSEKENILYVQNIEALVNEKLLFLTKLGYIKLVQAIEFDVIKKQIVSTKLLNDDELITIKPIERNDEVIKLTTQYGKSLIFPTNEISTLKKTSVGTKGISLQENDFVIESVFIEKNDKQMKIGKRGGKATKI